MNSIDPCKLNVSVYPKGFGGGGGRGRLIAKERWEEGAPRFLVPIMKKGIVLRKDKTWQCTLVYSK